jgi:hypothetical protein
MIELADAALQEWEPSAAMVDGLREWVTQDTVHADPDGHRIGVKASNWAGVAAPYWPQVLGDADEWLPVTRRDLFDLADTSRDGSWMPLFSATFAWGYGNVGYGPSRLRAILKNNDAEHIERKLTDAVEALSSEGAKAAYSVLRPWRSNVVWGFGPAFFSKFLYFAGWRMDVPGPKPLILDAQVAASIRLIAEPVYTRAGIDQDMASWLWPTSNWWGHRYGQYIELVHRVASLLPSDLPSRPDVLELALFDGRLRKTGVWDLT